MFDEPSRSVSRLAFDVAERGDQIVPCPLVSRGRPSYSSDVAGNEAPWIAVHPGVGPARLLASWRVAVEAGSRLEVGRAPRAYLIETSASSTNGRDGEWRRELSVDSNTASARVHEVEFDGQSWVRLTLAWPEAGSVLPLTQLDLHDASDGTDDCWLVLGDARLAALAPGAVATSAAGGSEAGWVELIHERYPGYFPALLDATLGDESPSRMLERLSGLLELHSPVSRVAIATGVASIQSVDRDVAALEAMVVTVLRSGRLPVLARRPAQRGQARDAVDAFNRGIVAIEQRHALVPGPDLATWFDAHPDQLDDEGQPSVEGLRAIARLWADAVDVWYVPQ